MSPIGWFLLALLLFLVEMATPGLFFFACLGAGAVLAGIASWFGASGPMAWGIFFGSSTLLVLLVAPLARRWMNRIPPSPVGLDALPGQQAMVVEALDPHTGRGQVRLENGALWRAVSQGPVTEGTRVRILEVVGTRLRVGPLSDHPSSLEPPHA